MHVRSLGFRTDLMIRRLAGSLVEDRGDHVVVRTLDNPGYYWGNFLLFAAPPAPGEAARYAACFREALPSARHVAIGVDGVDGDSGGLAGALGPAASLEVNTVLVADRLRPPARPAPAAVCRPMCADDDWEQELALRTRLGELEGQSSPECRRFLARRVGEARGLCRAGAGASFGAFVDGRLRAVAGIYGEAGGPGRYQEVATDPAWRRQGLATELVCRAGAFAADALGCRTLVIVADPEGPGIGLYRSLGFCDRERQVAVTCTPPPG